MSNLVEMKKGAPPEGDPGRIPAWKYFHGAAWLREGGVQER